MLQIYNNLFFFFFHCLETWYIMTAKIKTRQYVIFTDPRKFDTADIKCFTVTLIAWNYIVQGDAWQCFPFTYFLIIGPFRF